MRSLKRLVTALLAFVMILTCVGIPAFAADFSDITDQKVAEAVDKLVGFNIITGYEDGTFRPDNQITRAEFAAIVTRYKGIADSLPADAVTGFADLDNDSSRAWARPYVKAAVDLGIINGFKENDGTYTFRAGEPVTYEQAVKMLVCAVGYEVVAQSELNKIKVTNPNATWSAGYISVANKRGITKGVITAQITQPASRGVVAVLTSNTIDVDENEQSVEEIKGVVSGTYLTGLDAPTVDLGQNEIMIGTGTDKQTYELSDQAKKDIKDENRKSYAIEDLIGMNVVAYYDKFDHHIISIAVRNNKVTTIKEQDVISIDENTVKFYIANGNFDSVSLSGYTKIYNGKYLANDHTIIKNLDTYFKNGQIELIEAGGQKIAKITSYDVFVVDNKIFNDQEERIYFKYNKEYKPGETYYDFPATTSSKPEVYVNGVKKEVSGSLFNEWTVINLLESKDNNGSWLPGNKINKMYVTSGAKTGKVTEGIDEERKVILNDKEIYLTYDYSVNPDRVTEFKLNNTYTYYLDYTGQIAAVNKKAVVSNMDYKYGYIIGADEDVVHLILKDGTSATVEMKDKVKIDGKSVDKDGVKAKLISTAEVVYGVTGDCYQPVKYYITGSGDDAELVALDTVADSTGAKATAIGNNSDDQLIYNAVGTATATKSQVKVNGKTYDFDSKTVVIRIPEPKSSSDDYSVMTPSTAFAVGTPRKIEVLGADDSEFIKTAKLVLIDGEDPAYTFTGAAKYMLVTGKRVEKGKDVIEGYQEGSDSITSITISEEKFKSPDSSYVTVSEVEKGDIIRYIGNTSAVIAIQRIYKAGSNSFAIYGDESDYMYFKSHTSGIGELYMKYTKAMQVDDDAEDKKMYVTTAIEETNEDTIRDNLLKYKIDSSTVVYRIDGSNIKADKGIFEYINTKAGSNSEVIMITRSSSSPPTVKAIYIVK